jgi:FkbM family methyltransferase
MKKGMAGATGNFYMGLHEFNDMSFLLHLLRPGDMFYDVGANIGSYTILASAHTGSRSYSFEPIPATFNSLEKNIQLNKVSALVTPFNKGVGNTQGEMYFTSSLDTVNHVTDQDSSEGIQVEIISLDEIISDDNVPLLIKIDVEGFETEVLKGLQKNITNNNLRAIIIELNGAGARYGFDEKNIHTDLLRYGFQPFHYDPFSRTFHVMTTFGIHNTIYLRDVDFIKRRILDAEPVRIFSETF